MPSATDLYLLFSNVVIVIPIVYAFSRKLYAEASLLTTVGVISTLYHACQADFYCIFNSNLKHHSNDKLLQYSDEFFVDTTVIWFILFFLEFEIQYRIAVIFFVQPIFLLSVLSQSSHTPTIVLVTIFGITFFALLRSIFLYKRIYAELESGIIALILLISGFVIFYLGGDDGINEYGTLHSTWHILLMLSLLFIIRTKVTFGRYYLIFEVDKVPIKFIDSYKK
jgi:hypothetical protein